MCEVGESPGLARSPRPSECADHNMEERLCDQESLETGMLEIL